MADTNGNNPPLAVSDHALVRYMERIKGICLDEYRAEVRALADKHQDELSPTPGEFDNGFVIVIEALGLPIVTTVLGPGHRPKRKAAFSTRLIYVPRPAPEGE